MEENEVYAFQNTLKIRRDSASGGAFSAIVIAWKEYWKAKGVIDDYLIIYGSTFDFDFSICHQRAVGDEWNKFRGSKYGLSEINGVLSQIKFDLKQGKKVLFSGTPCQVATIKKITTGLAQENLFLVDIICHGIPEKRVWNDYVHFIEQFYGGKLIEYNFRYKKSSYIESTVFAKFNNGKSVNDSKTLRSYIDLYFTHLPLRKCCYRCKFANMNRISDISIGDFWGAKKVFGKISTKDGISQIIINTDKGSLLTKLIGEQAENRAFYKCTTKDFIQFQHNLQDATVRPKITDEFWDYYKINGYELSVKRYVDSGISYILKRLLARFGVLEIIKHFI